MHKGDVYEFWCETPSPVHAQQDASVTITNKDKLIRLLKGRVDYWPSHGEFPSVEHEHVTVDMSPEQTRIYEGVMQTNPILAYKIRHNLPPTKAEATQLNAFLSAARQVSNNPKAFSTEVRMCSGSPWIKLSPEGCRKSVARRLQATKSCASAGWPSVG